MRMLFAPEPSPETVPMNGEFAEIVTLFVAASNVVIVLLKRSRAVKVFAPVNAVPLVCGLASTNWKLSSAPGISVSVP